MKISCTQENLNQGLFVASHIASKSPNLPILNNILISVQKNLIKLSATNLEMGISCVIRGKIEQEGEFTVQSRLLAEYISLLPKERVDLTTPNQAEEDQILKISCKNYSTKIKGLPATEFPVIPEAEKTNLFRCPVKAFKKAVSQVIFAVSASETRPEIGGIFFNFSENKLVLAATDSYRLAEKTINLKDKNKTNLKIIVPSRAVAELLRILSGFKDPASLSSLEEIKIYVSENQIVFNLDNIELISRLVEGQYPDYQQIIPTASKTQAILEIDELIKAVKTASLFARSGIYDIGLEISPTKKEVIISSGNSQFGENISRLEAKIEGEPNSIALNYRYFLDGLQNLDSENLILEISDNASPCVVRPKDKDKEGGYLYIIMPIKQ